MPGAATFLQSAFDATGQSTYTFASQNLGTASSDRYIVVCAQSRRAGTNALSVSSVTVGGVAATIVAQEDNPASNNSVAAIAIAAVPTGTTGSVVVVFNLTMLRCNIILYSCTGIDPAAADTGVSIASTVATSLDIPANGIAIGSAVAANGISATWTGLTEDSDSAPSSLLCSSASDEFASAQTGLTVSCAVSGVIVNQVGVFASWGPTAGGVSLPNFVNHYRQQGIM